MRFVFSPPVQDRKAAFLADGILKRETEQIAEPAGILAFLPRTAPAPLAAQVVPPEHSSRTVSVRAHVCFCFRR